MLTHKIRDMPAHLFENKKSPTSYGNNNNNQQQQQQISLNNRNDEINEMSNMSNSNSTAAEDPKPTSVEIPESPPVNPEPETPVSVKRSPTESDLPVPKRQPSKKNNTQ